MRQDLEYSGEESYDSMYDEDGLGTYEDGERSASMAAPPGGAPDMASRATTGSDIYG